VELLLKTNCHAQRACLSLQLMSVVHQVSIYTEHVRQVQGAWCRELSAGCDPGFIQKDTGAQLAAPCLCPSHRISFLAHNSCAVSIRCRCPAQEQAGMLRVYG